VILLDANVLVYACVPSLPLYDRARAWLDTRLNGPERIGLPWASLLAFVRVVSNPRIFEPPETIAGAWGRVEEWLDCEPVWIPEPTERHRVVLGALMRAVVDRPKLVPDAHLAALAIEHGLTLCSTDGDFARFPGVRWQNPLGQDP
jgi:toxin-antitoxin system PIN domain toxin